MTAETCSVSFVDSARDVPDGLWEACFPPPLEGVWLYRALEESGLDDQFTFLYGLIRDGKRPVGIAPAFVMNVPIEVVLPKQVLPAVRVAGKLLPMFSHQRTLFVGSPCSDQGTVGLLPHTDRRAALSCLQRAVREKAKDLRAPMTVWKDFPEDDAPDLNWLAQQEGLFPLVSFPGTITGLPASKRKDDYYAVMKASRRQKLKRKLRHSNAAAAIDAVVVQNPPPGTLDEIFVLYQQTYERAKTKFERLNRAFFTNIAKEPASHFILMRQKSGGELLAFLLSFASGTRLISKYLGMDSAKPREWALWFRLWDAAVDFALAEGFTSIQSGQTVYGPRSKSATASYR